MGHVKTMAYLLSVVLLCGCTALYTTGEKFLQMSAKQTKIRHQRHMKRYNIDPVNSGEIKQKCTVKQSDDVTFFQGSCPKKKCFNHNGCWEEYGPSKLCICDPHLCGLVCLDFNDRCLIPRRPVNGNILVKDLRVGDQVEYSCDPGYALKGPRKRYCQANLKLSGKDPECTNQTDRCFQPPIISNTEAANGMMRVDYRNKETVQIVCQKGFKDINNPFIIARCDGNVWLYSPMNCERISCGKLNDPINGRSMYSNYYKFESEAIQFCNDAYKINCSLIDPMQKKDCKRVCEANGQWSGGEAICNPILCPELSSPENGKVMGHWNTVNSIKTLECNEGYQIAGSDIRKCQHNGEWDGSDAVCNVRDCGPPPRIPFASVRFKNTTHGSDAVYRCENKTTMIGNTSILRCGQSNGKSAWIPQPVPRCMRHCPFIDVRYGKVMVDDKISKPHFLLNSIIQHAVQIKVICDHGFELNRQEMPICDNGSLSYIPQCVEASCKSRPSSIKFSTVRFYSLTHNSVARYYCHTGYRMRSAVEDRVAWMTSFDIKCNMGNWTHIVKGGCQATTCPNLDALKNGDVYLQGQNDRTKLLSTPMKLEHNRMVKYECYPDYRLIGPKMAICLNGKWSPSEKPKCEYIIHDELPLLWLYYSSSRK